MNQTSTPIAAETAVAETLPDALQNRLQPIGIDIRDLSLSFGATQVLKGIDLKIEPGEFFAFLGPSGSGKSTLLRAIAGFGPTPKGTIALDGQDVVGLAPWKRNVGMVFQNYALWPHMSVARNVAYGLDERRVPKRESVARVNAALELVGMRQYADRYPSQLSGGQQQRVALARTIVVEPRVLLLDEPLSNLDANLRVQMRQDLLKLQRRLGITTIFVTHDQEEANTICDRIAVMADGVVQQIGKPDDVYDNPANSFVANFLGTANVLEGHVEKAASGPVFRSAGGLELPCGDGKAGAAKLVLRPQSIAFVDGGAADGLQGRVRSAEFLGGMIRYLVDVGGEALLVDELHARGSGRRREGEAVHVRINHEQAVLIHR
ncbi:ABC transporter ATP-binding protein [Nitratireductor pacificus]|uniref:ABC transporter related protein n=1 Tax=Nitratireductor pacificus pht-3B TaxID=391937 RepID=K2LN50_9HYPH|nr:ABC transporter ATP-binding protein [Nitratireductor pacificus]EKF19169.1 ABC transporter related protein [Nitratireductor pacificus pht-3B]